MLQNALIRFHKLSYAFMCFRMLYNAFICFHMLSYASKSFYNKSLYMLLYPFIRFHALSYAFIHFRMLSYAFICFTMLLYAMEATYLLYKHKVSPEADRGSRVYRLYLRKPVKNQPFPMDKTIRETFQKIYFSPSQRMLLTSYFCW